jgi:hypothetical protein
VNAVTEGDSGGGWAEEPPALTDEEFAALAQGAVVLGADKHRYIATTDRAGLAAVAEFARQYPELADLAAAIEHAATSWHLAGVEVVRVSCRWTELQEWLRLRDWQVLRIPGARRERPDGTGLTGPVYWMRPRPSISPEA